jgi:hypothetical protein
MSQGAKCDESTHPGVIAQLNLVDPKQPPSNQRSSLAKVKQRRITTPISSLEMYMKIMLLVSKIMFG